MYKVRLRSTTRETGCRGKKKTKNSTSVSMPLRGSEKGVLEERSRELKSRKQRMGKRFSYIFTGMVKPAINPDLTWGGRGFSPEISDARKSADQKGKE